MALFFKEEEEIVEETSEDLDYIDLDKTAGWSKLEVADQMVKQRAKSMLEEIGEDLANMDAQAEEVEIEEISKMGVKEDKPCEFEHKEVKNEVAVGKKADVPEKSSIPTTFATEERLKENTDGEEELTEEEVEFFHIEEKEDIVEEDDDDEEESPFVFFDNLAAFFANWTLMDKVVAMTGVVVLIVAIFTVSAYAGNRGVAKQIEAFVPIGEQLETIGVTGQDKLLAVADAKKAMMEAAKLEAELNQEYEENELSSEVQVTMKLNSVQKDLKVKFVNKKTEKLVGNVAFEIEIIDADNKKYNKIDEDKDGIIYLADIIPGNYSVSMVELEGMEGYTFTTEKMSVKVKEKIDYKKIDVSDEIKDQSEVNVAQEDTAKKTETEGTLQDTVEWVESTKTEAGGEAKYVKVEKSTIADPGLSASLTLDMNILEIMQKSGVSKSILLTSQTIATISENDASGEGAQEEVIAVTGVTLNKTEVTLNLESNAKTQLEVMVLPVNATNTSVVWSSDNTQVATVENGVVTAIGAGTANITVASAADNSKTAVCKVTVTGKTTEKEEDNKDENSQISIQLDKTSASLKVGESLTLKGTVTPSDKAISWSSSKKEVATVDEKGKVVAIAEGETEITATVEGKSAVCKITVNKADGSKDNTSKEEGSKPLKDKSGNQIYIKKDGNYVEAKVADYYNYKEFYKKEASSEYKYTGWQNLDGRTYYFDKNGNKVTGEQVIQGAKYSFNSDGSLNTGSGILGIDVSTWNGTIDWNKVKSSGVSYVIIRTGFRGSTQGALVEDNRFRQNIKGATNAGLKVGVYFFSQAVNEVEAVEEASMVLSQIKGYSLAYPVFIDVEPSGGRADKIDVGTRTKVVNAFCQTIQNSGYKAGIYANKTWFSEKLNTSALSGYKIWLAQYNTHVTYTGRYDMWQYSEKGKINGISGNVDMNLSYLAY